ncbi:MAG: DUF5982 domain-containing protein [Bacteroidia bacterium]|nr:outer membrane protein assembly factor [Bacteroidia bacterium]MDW8157389.1 DUF5982 domain-containing protein [Bacteroidia bacterium]
MKKLSLSFMAIITITLAWAQNSTDTLRIKERCPLGIDLCKKLPDFELATKKEGTFLTGLPRVEFDPIRGLGLGGDAFLYFNKTRNDPFFEYTPYRHRFNLEFFIFTNGRIRYALNYDAPYIFNSKWRVRADAVLWEDPNAQYWGIGRSYLKPLQFRDKKTGSFRNFNKVEEYENNLALAELGENGNYYTDYYFNQMQQREQLYNILVERVMLGGKLRFLFGYEALFTSFSSYQNLEVDECYTIDGQKVKALNKRTLVDIQREDGTWEKFNITGFTNSHKYMFTSMIAAALIYDTRDFEPDPSKGVFLEYSHEYSGPWLGSQFHFNKFMLQGQYFYTLKKWRNNKNRLTLAGLTAFGYIFGPKINFIEMWDLSSQAEAGGILVLGGNRSIRGFREARFVAPTVALVNLEARVKFYDFHFLKQHFTLGAIAFYDFGSIWDKPAEISFDKWISAPGLGARINWNQSTVIRLDYATSKEGSQTFLGFGHIF